MRPRANSTSQMWSESLGLRNSVSTCVEFTFAVVDEIRIRTYLYVVLKNNVMTARSLFDVCFYSSAAASQ